MTVGFNPKGLEVVLHLLFGAVGADGEFDHPLGSDLHPGSRDVEKILVRIESTSCGGNLNSLDRQRFFDGSRVDHQINHLTH